uniref:LRRNT_2 domain-containing protein n=1 Tax=Heterorhabditis bacteriophora TaxID=37862 RepID=A0A1I7W6Q8_HETBA
MALHHTCTHGEMSSQGTIWRTTNRLTIDWPSEPLGCCSEQEVSLTSCIVFKSSVSAHARDEMAESPVGSFQGCKYRDGYCSLKDGSLAIWTPEESEKCKYIFVSKMKGFLLGNVWLSDNKEFALSFNNNSYAIAKLHITKRDTLYQVGLVTSNQFASQLLALEGSIHSSVSAMFNLEWAMACNKMNTLWVALLSSLVTRHQTNLSSSQYY